MNPYTLTEAEADLRVAIDAGNEHAIAALGATVDRLDPRPSTPSLHSAALWYVAQGLRVFPLQPGAKVPFKGSNGCKGATTDAEMIDAWWAGNPAANIGIATGHLVDVIDVDGPAGVRSYLDILDELPPVLGKVSTPRAGGTHLYVVAVPGRGNKAGLLAGIDYRGLGGYVVAPPSVNAEGTPYAWRSPLDLAGVREVAA